LKRRINLQARVATGAVAVCLLSELDVDEVSLLFTDAFPISPQATALFKLRCKFPARIHSWRLR